MYLGTVPFLRTIPNPCLHIPSKCHRSRLYIVLLVEDLAPSNNHFDSFLNGQGRSCGRRGAAATTLAKSGVTHVMIPNLLRQQVTSVPSTYATMYTEIYIINSRGLKMYIIMVYEVNLILVTVFRHGMREERFILIILCVRE